MGAIIGGGTPSAGDSENFAQPGEGIPWLTPADLGGFAELYKVDELMALCDRLEAGLSADSTRRRLLEAVIHEALEPAAGKREAA